MNNYQFYELLLSSPLLFLVIIILVAAIHFFLFRKNIRSIFDPYFFSVIASVFGSSDVIFLYLNNEMSSYVFSNFIVTQLLFFVGLFFTINFKKIVKTENKKSIRVNYTPSLFYDKTYNIIAFYFFSIVYLIVEIIIYATKGIPLFMQSRLETFTSGDGSGILSRLSDISSICCLYSLFTVVKFDKWRISQIPIYIIASIIFLTFFLSGSKSSFLIFFNVFWCFILFKKIKDKDYMIYVKFFKKNTKRILVGLFFGAIAMLAVQTTNVIASSEESANPLLILFLRFIHSGDIFWYAYPNNVYLQINPNPGLAALFSDFLGFLRIYNWNDLPEAIGITFKNIHHPSDVPSGPNARHNVFGLIYYGYVGSIIFSFFLGVIIGFIRSFLADILKYNLLGGYIYTYLFIRISGLDSDPMLTFTYINNIVFVFPILFILFLVFKNMIQAKKKAMYNYG